MANNQPLIFTPHKKPKSCSKTPLYTFIFLAAIVLSITLLSTLFFYTKPSDETFLKSNHVCHRARDPSSCMAVVSEVSSAVGTRKEIDGVGLLRLVMSSSYRRIHDAVELSEALNRRINDGRAHGALVDCIHMLDLSLDMVMDSMAALRNLSGQARSDAHTWLSSVLTNHDTCLDGLSGPARPILEPILNDLITRASSSLAIFVTVAPSTSDDDLRQLNGDVPRWLSRSDRRLLELSGAEIKANAVVAKDGSGNYKTVTEAVAAAPEKSKNRYVIYVKKGTYKENVEIGKKKTNVMLVGDGMDSTIITGDLNVVDGSTTFNSATVAAVGEGFIAQDMCFQNTAGPQKHQAVALRVGADKSAINRCKIDAYQDTLYAHSQRQFYRDSIIMGTVDFIFGNAAVVIQNSKLIARKPMSNQQNMVTAQGRTDPNQPTGTSIQKCEVSPSSDLGPVKTYLGRPWKEYSRTVVMQSEIGAHIDPAGWAPWDGDFALKTLFFGEYMNSGPGAGTSKRVTWPGYHVINDVAVAMNFTVAKLIQGGSWLKNSGISYTEGL